MADITACMSSENMGWRTPQLLVNYVHAFAASKRITLDPCTEPCNPTKALVHIAPPADGLTEDWYETMVASGATLPPRHLVYMNPPYGRAISDWVAVAHDHAIIFRATADTLVLVPARTETTYWTRYIWSRADAILFFNRRLQFEDNGSAKPLPAGKKQANQAPFPSALVYYGTRADDFRMHFELFGKVIFPQQRYDKVSELCPTCLNNGNVGKYLGELFPRPCPRCSVPYAR